MAVIKVKAEKVVRMALAIVERNVVSPWLSMRIPDEQNAFKGALNDTISVEVGELKAVARDYEFRTRTAPIVMDDIQGGGKLAFKLDTHVTSATSITLEQLTLDEIELVNDVIGPQAEAVAASMEAKVIAKHATIPWKRTMAIGPNDDPLRVAAEAKRLLDADKVAPANGRVFIVGSNVAMAWIASDRLSRYDSTGQEGTPALPEVGIVRLAGSVVVTLPDVDPNFVWYGHRSALAVASVAPVVPVGAVTGRQGMTRSGFAGTWIADYDAPYARDRSLFHAYLGLTDVRDERNAAGDLLDPTGASYATAKNVRGIGITALGFGSVLITPAWKASTVYAVGDRVTLGAGQVQATVGGTSGASAPALPGAVGGTVTDNTVTWKRVA